MDGRIDIAVHSLKDVPMEENPDFPILACGRREDPRDVLLLKPGLHKLPEDGVVGTSSSRRMIQMKRRFPGCSFRGIRGNVQTRLRKLETEGYDVTLLAAAGLKRLEMAHVIGNIFPWMRSSRRQGRAFWLFRAGKTHVGSGWIRSMTGMHAQRRRRSGSSSVRSAETVRLPVRRMRRSMAVS